MPEVVIGKESGIDNVGLWAPKVEINLSEDEKMAVVNRVKLRSHELKRVLAENGFKGIVGEVKGANKSPRG